MTGVLARLIAPLTVEQFVAESWSRQRLHLSGRDEGYSDILTRDGVEELLLKKRGRNVLSQSRIGRVAEDRRSPLKR